MSHSLIKNANNYATFEISPFKTEIRSDDWTIPSTVSVCSPSEVEEWALYGRLPNGEAVWLLDGSQTEVLSIAQDELSGRPIYLKTSLDCHHITEFKCEPSFAVMPCRIGDNGVLIPQDSVENVEVWGLLVYRPNEKLDGHTYVELGRHNNKDAAYFALSAILMA